LAGAMENLTMPVTRNIIETDLDASHAAPVNWQKPAGIQTLSSFHSAIAYSSQVAVPSTDIFPSWYKPKAASSQTASIDKVSNKAATACTPPLAVQTIGGSTAVNSFSIDPFYPPGGSNSNASGTANTANSDDVHSCSDSPPSVSIAISDNGTPPSGSTGNTCTGSCTITAAISQGTHPFDDPQYPQYPGTVTFSVNGQEVKTITTASGGPYSFQYTATSSGSGTVSVQVTDSVLYSASDQATVTFSTSGGGLGFRGGPPGASPNGNQTANFLSKRKIHHTTSFF